MFIGPTDIPALAILALGVVFSISTRRLTVAGALAGLLCGAIIYAGAGYEGLLGLTLMFGLATGATSLGRRRKQEVERAEDGKARRASQVLANCGTATLCSIGILCFPAYSTLFTILLFSALASALSDTLSSELGTVYGRNFYHILSWKRDARGLDGVISLEGTLAGLGGATTIALYYAAVRSFDIGFIIIILAGMMGNLFDSYLGATLERRNMMGNDMVNFSSTLFATFSAGGMFLIFKVF